MAGPTGNHKVRGAAYKAKNFKGTVLQLIKGFKPLLPLFIIVTIMIIGSVVMTIITPVILGDTMRNLLDFFSIDGTGFAHVKWGKVFSSFGLMLGLYAGSALLAWVADFIIVRISANYAYDLRKQIKTKLDKMPLSYFDCHTYGEILNRGTNDVDTISRSMQQIVNQTINGITMFIGVIIAMFIVEWRLAFVAIAILPFTITLTVVIALKSQKQFVKYRTELSEMNSHIEECYGGFRIIKLFNKEEDVISKFEDINQSMTSADRWSQFLSGLIFPAMRFINNLGFIGVSIVSGLLNPNSIGGTIGYMVTFFSFLQLFQQPFQQIGQISSVIQSTVAAAEKIFDLLKEEEIIPEVPNPITDETIIDGQMTFDHVNFSYKPDKPLIEDMNLVVNQGDSIAIVGPTGAGKTTIVNLIMRFYELNSGAIVMDGHNINDFTRGTLRGSVGMVLQDTWLFSGTIRDNIKYADPTISDEDVEKAARAAHAHHFITTLPKGYDFVLNEDGANISQGQRQLITIARAIASKPRILILDEATSSVDTRTEVAIQDAMNKMMEGKTSFIIAHRLSTIKNAKMIIVMNKGKIIESGSHKELLAKNGFYADLYNAQFTGSNPLAAVESDT